MEINTANVAWRKIFLWEARLRRQKKNQWAVYRRNTRNYGQYHPSNNKKTIKFGMRIINGTYPFKFPLKAVWTSRFYSFMKITYVTTTTTTIFTLMLLNGLLFLVEPNFRNRQRKCQKKNWTFFGRVFAPLRGIAHCQFYKSSSMKSIWEPQLIVSFVRCRSINHFPLCLNNPAFTEANKALEHLQKSSEKQATLPA